MDHAKSQFVLKGFQQDTDFRIFTFEHTNSDNARSLFTVRADLALARGHHILLQELPLLCRGFLEKCYQGGDQRSFVFSEDHMRLYASGVAEREEEAKQKKLARRPRPENLGAGWKNSNFTLSSGETDKK